MLEKMTQVSTDAIVPVDKYNSLVAEYNHLVDICNDSAERIDDLISCYWDIYWDLDNF